ncbi:uncharacterized protein LOC113797996 [Dermatophagoides pteronyssinus]|uniref:Gastrula zinc finger protein XlCGF49.1-like n=1 Tax=Dermatophagoides pteronyssinus TaxID=6956 RepID=A0A6P6YFJ5_DERPT|nr:gastrula zinc finger protein XlCGF49.1-like [Dermatophagoides pteronyssinus]
MDENIDDIRSCSKLIMCNGNTLYTTRIYGDLDTINKLKQSSKVKTPIKRCVQPLPSTAGTSLSLKSKLKPIIVNSNKNDDDDDTTDIMGKNLDIVPTLNADGKEEFKCPICKFTFVRLYDLKRHCRTHTADRPFACKYCGNMFKRKKTLKLHIRIHTGEKPYRCPLCSYSSTQSQNVYKHIRIHTGEKPFKCDQCDKRFSEKQGLKLHRTIHEAKQFCCKYCPNFYSRRDTLRAHMYEKHKTERDREYEAIVAEVIELNAK